MDEANEVKRAIQIIRKAMTPRESTLKGRKGGGSNPRESFTLRVVEVVKHSMEPMTTQQIALALNAQNGPYLDGILTKAEEKGRLRKRDGHWEIPPVGISNE